MAWKVIQMEDTEFMIVPENPDHFVAYISDEKGEEVAVHLGLFVEEVDMREITDEYDDEEYHIALHLSIGVIDPINEDFLEDANDAYGCEKIPDDPYMRAYIVYEYIGGVPVTDVVLDAIEENFGPLDLNEGDLAKDWGYLDKIIREYIPKVLPVIARLVGFYLDRPINRIGNTGWDIINTITTNRDFLSIPI